MPKLYLTIDDGPSEKFTAMVDFLADRDVQAVFFNRGDAMEQRPEAVIYGIQKGFIMANHAYSHRRFSKLPLETCYEEIARTESILYDLYRQAGVEKPGQYFRFPYMDRGMGSRLVEPESASAEHQQVIDDLLQSGLGHTPPVPAELCDVPKKRDLQHYLRAQGFVPLPVQNVTLPWYAETEMAQAIDSLCTFSTSDWAVSERHKGKHGYNDLDDLKERIDHDPYLRDNTSYHIVLAHDQPEIHDVTCGLIDHFLGAGFEFLDFHLKTH